MEKNIVDIATISELHALYRCPGPIHPLITVLDLTSTDRSNIKEDIRYTEDRTMTLREGR